MPHDLSRHPLFSPWKDPQSGVTSYILTPGDKRVAPVQQNFYFVNPSISPDENWLWFTCAFPPNPTRTLAVVSLDPANPVLRHFPQAAENTGHPLIAPDNSGVYFGCGAAVYHVSTEGTLRCVFELPAAYVAGRVVHRLSTHLSLSADGRYLLLDGAVGDHWFVGTADLHKPPGDAAGFRLIKEFAHNHNHGQFAPAAVGDASAFVLAQDHARSPVTGRTFHHNIRAVLMDTADSRYDVLMPTRYPKHCAGPSHEFWSRDGFLCYVDYQLGAFELDVRPVLAGGTAHPPADPAAAEWTGPRARRVWGEELCHAHCNSDRSLWVADESPYKWTEKPCQVLFFDRRAQRRGVIASALPVPSAPRGPYHIDPHPQFSPGDSYVIYTTTVHGGQADVAVVDARSLRG